MAGLEVVEGHKTVQTGVTFIRGVEDVGGAQNLARTAAAEIGARLGFEERLDVMAVEPIPPPTHGIQSTFQALHVDFGLPVTAQCRTDLHLVVALYRPMDPGAEHTALTRVVAAKDIAGQRSWPSPEESWRRIESYGQSHGSWLNWDRPGYRELTLARFIDAMDGTAELLAFRNIPREDWYRASNAGNLFANEEQERQFLLRHMIDLAEVERRFRLLPGQLLLIDNTRAFHARSGLRPHGEIFRLLIGIRQLAPSAAISATRSLVEAMTATF